MPLALVIAVMTVLAVLLLATLAVLLVVLLRSAGRGGPAQQRTVVDELARLRENLDQKLDRSRQTSEAGLRDSREAFDRRFSELTQQVNHRLGELHTQLHTQLAENRKQVGDSTQVMLERLEQSGKLFSQITQQFGQLQESSRRLTELGADIGKLQQILSPSSHRGKFGELLLEELLKNMLPAGHFACQHGFADGCVVDAVVKLARGMVCIDSKFPLDAFQRFLSVDGSTGPEARKAAHKDFVRDCRRHIDAIARKYIRPDEGTLDFALMYIPAENVYYETIIAHSDLGQAESISQQAMARRVVCVSPNSLVAYLQVIMIGLKGLQIEENARHILAGLSRVGDEMNRFADDFRLVGRHLENAGKKYAEAERQLGKVSTRFEQVAQLGQSEAQETPALRLAAET